MFLVRLFEWVVCLDDWGILSWVLGFISGKFDWLILDFYCILYKLDIWILWFWVLSLLIVVLRRELVSDCFLGWVKIIKIFILGNWFLNLGIVRVEVWVELNIYWVLLILLVLYKWYDFVDEFVECKWVVICIGFCILVFFEL